MVDLPSSLLLMTMTLSTTLVTDATRGDYLRDRYFRHEVQSIADNCLAKPLTKADWERARPELRREFLDMLGLWPLPPRTNLHATITGTVETDGFTVEQANQDRGHDCDHEGCGYAGC